MENSINPKVRKMKAKKHSEDSTMALPRWRLRR
jgi:hypothetical protein